MCMKYIAHPLTYRSFKNINLKGGGKFGYGKMVQCVKVPKVKPDNLSSIPRTHMVKGRLIPEVFSYLHRHATHRDPHVYTK